MTSYLRVPDVPFTDASVWTPELGYFSFQAPVFDDEEGLLGHRERLRDDELSNAATAIKARFAAIEDGLRPVRPTTGRLVTVRTGVVADANGNLVTIPQTVLQMADNATSFIYATTSGVLEVSPVRPVISSAIASVTVVNGEISSFVDLRNAAIRRVMPTVSAIKTFGGNNDQDLTVTNGQTLGQGIYYCRDFNVPSGVTVTIDRFVKVICSGNANISGTILGTDGLSEGASQVLVSNATPGLQGYQRGFGKGGGGGQYPWAIDLQGSGGSAGGYLALNTVGNGYVARAGGSGATVWIEAINIYVLGNGAIRCKGGNGLRGSTTAAYNSGNASGTGAVVTGGGGGGSGGLVYLAALTEIRVALTATIDVSGGNGGGGFVANNTTSIGFPGNGGGGGYAVFMAPQINISGANIDVTAGNIGAPFTLGAGMTVTSPLVFSFPRTWTGVTGGFGGGFGGSTGSVLTSVDDGTRVTITSNASTAGQLILRNYCPVGS